MQDFIRYVTRWDSKQKGGRQLPQKPVLFPVSFVFTTLSLQLPNCTQRRVPLAGLNCSSLLPTVVHCCKLASCAVQSKGLGQADILHQCPSLPPEPVLKIWRFDRSKYTYNSQPTYQKFWRGKTTKKTKIAWEAELSGLYPAEIQKALFCMSLEWSRTKSITGCN